MRSLIREPLVHFLLGGALLFVLYDQVGRNREEPRDRIMVTSERVESLTAFFERTWMRPPTEAELAGLVDDYVIEEALYREALALGLDRDDLIVRRRMRQKMEYLSEDLGGGEPDDAALRAFLERHPERFAVPARLSFEQVLVRRAGPASSADDGDGDIDARATAMLERLRAGEPADGLGDPTALPARLDAATPHEISGSFGDAFAEALTTLANLTPEPDAGWQGPVASTYGLHLVRIEQRIPGRSPSLEEARRFVEREWEAEQRAEARERFYDDVRARYDVEVRDEAAARARAGAAGRSGDGDAGAGGATAATRERGP